MESNTDIFIFMWGTGKNLPNLYYLPKRQWYIGADYQNDNQI